jgi:diphthamide synthase (EF-2-diphthine--ammonia ligase)
VVKKFQNLTFIGGKDSCYNLIKCVQHGHEIICIANLAPKDKTTRKPLKY